MKSCSNYYSAVGGKNLNIPLDFSAGAAAGPGWDTGGTFPFNFSG
jgi:hypothetical protein